MTVTTWNPSDKSATISLSNGNLTATKVGINGAALVRCILIQTTGKYYIEHTVDLKTTPFFLFGLANASAGVNDNLTLTNTAGYNEDGQVWINSVLQTSLLSFTTADVVCMAYDADNDRLWFRKNNGNWNNNALNDPAANVGGYDVSAMKSTGLYAAFSPSAFGGKATTAFGAAGYTFTPPAGFTTWGPLPPIDELDISKLDGFTLIGPADEIIISKLDGWSMIGPTSPPPGLGQRVQGMIF